MLGRVLIACMVSVIVTAGHLASSRSLWAEESPRATTDSASPSAPESLNDSPGTSSEPFQLPPVDAQDLPPATAQTQFEVSGFVFEGNRVIASSELQRIAALFIGRIVTRAELEELRQALSRYYVERGYINSGALLNADFYRDGIVHFVIVEGRVDHVRLTGLGRLRESYVRDRLHRVDEPLNINVLQERFQLLLADPLFAKVNARLQPGAAPGRATLDVDVTRARPYDVSVFLNNYRPPSIGAEALGLTARVRNLTGLGDVVDATVLGGRGNNDRLNAGWLLPMIDTRTQLHARYDHGRSSVLEEPLDALDVKSVLDSREVGISRAFVESTRSHLSLGLTFVHRQNRTQLLGEPFSFVPGEPTGTSKVNAWRFDQDFVQRWEKQVLAVRSTLVRGQTNTVDAEVDSVKHDVRSNDNHLGRFVGDDCRWSEGHLGSF
jgi:hemolysin activation/secretion protein